MGRPSLCWWGALFLATVLTIAPMTARGEEELGHEVALGLTGVYDAGYDRGLHVGLSYEFSWSLLRASALFSFGDTDPTREQHWAVDVGVVAWQRFRIDVAFHHRTFTPLGFGENLVRLSVDLRWRGLEAAAGYILRFPIVESELIHSPFVFDDELFDHFLIFRLGYIWDLPRGFGLGLLTGNFSRFEIHNLDYPQFALVLTYEHALFGRLRLDVGIGTAGFFNQGATIDRGFIRLEYSRLMRQRRRAADEEQTP